MNKLDQAASYGAVCPPLRCLRQPGLAVAANAGGSFKDGGSIVIPFGPYHLRERLAVSAMSEVFLASPRDQPSELRVVKRLLPHLESKDEFVRMFEDEARLTVRLCHRGIVRVERRGVAGGVHFIGMEYVDGLTLAELIEAVPGQRLPFYLGCWIVAEACAALAYAHELADERGRALEIIHRDVSPDNILLSRQGEVKLLDFGIAKAKMRLATTRPGEIKGKLAYMSPEQLRGESIDRRSDVFGLGLVLYEVTAGRPLFAGISEARVLQARLQRSFDMPDRLFAECPPVLAEVVRRALDWDPERRFVDAAAMREPLLALIPDDHWPAGELARQVMQYGKACRASTSPGNQTEAPGTAATLTALQHDHGRKSDKTARLTALTPGSLRQTGAVDSAAAVTRVAVPSGARGRRSGGHVDESREAPAVLESSVIVVVPEKRGKTAHERVDPSSHERAFSWMLDDARARDGAGEQHGHSEARALDDGSRGGIEEVAAPEDEPSAIGLAVLSSNGTGVAGALSGWLVIVVMMFVAGLLALLLRL